MLFRSKGAPSYALSLAAGHVVETQRADTQADGMATRVPDSNALAIIRAGAEMVKLEGGEWLLPTVQMLVARGIPVYAHLGLTPQSVHQLGGFRVQARETDDAQRLLDDALALQTAGAAMLVLEAIPAKLAAEVTAKLSIPTIGIGAGVDCSGQVLVMHDMLGVFPGKRPKFVHDFMQGQTSISAAIRAYVQAVKQQVSQTVLPSTPANTVSGEQQNV